MHQCISICLIYYFFIYENDICNLHRTETKAKHLHIISHCVNIIINNNHICHSVCMVFQLLPQQECNLPSVNCITTMGNMLMFRCVFLQFSVKISYQFYCVYILLDLKPTYYNDHMLFTILFSFDSLFTTQERLVRCGSALFAF